MYALKWNPFHSRVFLSCSADWTIKMWDMNSKVPISTFDLQCAINDIEWSPYSSTIFGAVTSQGNLVIYDLNVSRHSPLCEQPITTKSKPTHLSFNPFDPILLVGDEKGGSTLFRLSPNLRRNTMTAKDEDKKDDKEKKSSSPLKQAPKDPAILEVKPVNVRKSSFMQPDELKTLGSNEAKKMEAILEGQKKELY